MRDLLTRLRDRFGTRALGIVVALSLELLLIALLLTLGRSDLAPAGSDRAIVTFDVRSVPAAPEQEAEQQPDDTKSKVTMRETNAEPVPEMPPPAVIIPRTSQTPTPTPSKQAIIPLSRDELDATDLANLTPPPPSAAKPVAPAYGSAGSPSTNDTEVVGRAPDGSPLYAARWYREPSHGELSGYLSTASGPGWALIACKTAPKWRVENCVGLEEYPTGSNIERSVLAAAWQFQVRPPRRGNDVLVGSWVRIRITYIKSAAGG